MSANNKFANSRVAELVNTIFWVFCAICAGLILVAVIVIAIAPPG